MWKAVKFARLSLTEKEKKPHNTEDFFLKRKRKKNITFTRNTETIIVIRRRHLTKCEGRNCPAS